MDILRGDLRDYDAVVKAAQKVDVVFHLGALVGVPYSFAHPADTADTNIWGTLNVLMAAREAGVRRVVHTSSSEVYGTARYAPIDEAHPLQAQSPYAATKIAADKIAESFFCTYRLPVVTIRPFNTFGPRQSIRAVIPTIVAQALAGHEVRLGNTTPRRDFTYVADTVEGLLLAGTRVGIEGRTINLGTSQEVSVGDLVTLVGECLGKTLTLCEDETRMRPPGSEVDRLISDNRLAREILGWSPKVSLNEGLHCTVEWMARHPGLYRAGEYGI